MAELIKAIRRLPEGTVVEACGEVDLRQQPEFQKTLLEICDGCYLTHACASANSAAR